MTPEINTYDINISFDYDGTLNTKKGLDVFNKLKEDGYNIRVTTTRREVDKNQDLWKVCNSLGIENVVFTNLNMKWDYMHNIDVHIDNDPKELNLISQYTFSVPILITDENFDEKLNTIIDGIRFYN